MLDLTDKDPERLRRILLVVLALVISLLFLWMIHQFLIALLFAAILTGMFHPLYRGLTSRFRGRKSLASATTVLLVFVLVIGPLIGFLVLVASQAIQLEGQARRLVEARLRDAPGFDELIKHSPILHRLEPYREQILEKAGEIASQLGSMAVGAITEAARRTVAFFFMLFVTLYSMFFFLIDGRMVLRKILYYLPLPADDENQMVDRFVSVTRATIKGTLAVGAVQGALGGLAFSVIGIEGAALWGTLMAVFSVLPGIGTALVWLPAVVYLSLIGRVTAAVILFAWCVGVVGTIDNLLRPWLVGKDTKMPDLLILLSTLGGVVLFGFAGLVIGPIVAALFVTVWDLYGIAFKGRLPEPEPAPSSTMNPPVVDKKT